MQLTPSQSVQVRFDSVNPSTPIHALADNEVAQAVNVDFGIGQGALMPRRGSVMFGTVAGGFALKQIFRNYNNPNTISANQFYVVNSGGTIYRGSASSWQSLGTSAASRCGINSYQQYALLGGNANLKDDGTSVTEWVKQSPPAPTVTINTLTALSFLGSGFAVTQGTLVSGSTTATVVTDTLNRAEITLSFGSSSDLNHNGTATIGDFGIHFVDLAFSDPTIITKVSQDYSIGDANFYNYWHAEITPTNSIIDSAQPDPDTLIDSQLAVGTATTSNLTLDDRARMISQLRDQTRPTLSGLSHLSAVLSPWGVTRTDFGMVGKYSPTAGTDPWGAIYAVRYTIEANGTATTTIRVPEIRGAQNYPLNDTGVGYSYWQTFATLDSSGNKIGEGAPSPPSARLTMQEANTTVTLAGTATGTQHGITHIITYRQGGYTRDAYAINTQVYSSGAAITDTVNDIQALSLNFPLNNNIFSRSTFPGNIFAISEPFADRVFVGHDNTLRWTLPGQIDTFPQSSFTRVSNIGDNIKGLITWSPGLVIVNQNSVYELSGTDFEEGGYILSRSASKRGSIAPGTIIKTPYGIPLLNYDGLSMYVPGQGSDVELQWLMDKYGDMFRGGESISPAARKGSRIPAINYSFIIDCSAAYVEGKLYLAAPTGSSTTPDTVYVIDFINKKVWWYAYPFNVSSLFFDYQDSRFMAGTSDGVMIMIERGEVDTTSAGFSSLVTWVVKTRQWSANTDTVLENVSFDYEGAQTLVLANLDTGTSITVTTLTNSVRQWINPPLNGTFVNALQFTLFGTYSAATPMQALYQMTFDLLSEPVKVRYYRTDYDEQKYPGDKLWDVVYHDIDVQGAGNVLAVTLVDNTAVTTSTISGPTNGRVVQMKAFPAETYGRVAYTTYTSSSTSVTFKRWDTNYESRPEPPKVNNWRTDITSLEENICDAFDVDINPGGTAVLGTCFVDNIAIATGTFTGNNRQSYTFKLPTEVYGRTIYVAYNGSAFKHYKTWFHLRPEPDRWTNFVTDRHSELEEIWDAYECDINCLGNNVTGTFVLDGTALNTTTFFGTDRQSFVTTLPNESYGRTARVIYNVVGGGIFKHFKTWFSSRHEPDRLTNYVSDRKSGDEQIFDGFDCDLNAFGNFVLATAIIDGTAATTATFFGNGRQSYSSTIPRETYGRTAYVIYNAVSGRLKHYNTWFDSRPEPDRCISFVSDKVSGDEHEWKVFKPELNPLGNTVLCTAIIDGTAVGTFSATGSTRQQYTFSLPVRTFGRTIWASYSSGVTVFKHYSTDFEGDKEPPRVTTYRTGPYPYPSSQYLKTWLAELDPITGTVTGTLIADDVVINTTTFTGDRRQWFTVGMDLTNTLALTTASRWEAIYSASGKFKHYDTKMETEPKPFGKPMWSYSYKKIGGANQIDLGRFWSIEAEAAAPIEIQYYWDIDSANFTLGTITLTDSGPQWIDRIAFPPGARGYIFQFRGTSTANFKINKVNIDLAEEGIKGLVRREHQGTPHE